MIKYNYRYILAFVVAIVILAVIFYVVFPMQEVMSLIFFVFPVLGVLWRYVNFIRVNDDSLELVSFLKKRRFDYKDIQKIILDKDHSLHTCTLEITVVHTKGQCVVPFGNLKYEQAKKIKWLIGDKANVVLR